MRRNVSETRRSWRPFRPGATSRQTGEFRRDDVHQNFDCASGYAARGGQPAAAQLPKSGSTFRFYQRDNPASESIHEEATYYTNIPFMPVFNNLIVYKQDEARNTVDNIVPELATSWTWSGDQTALIFKLRDGVTWHDGKPFTSADVKCTFDLIIEKGTERFRKNPRKG